MKCDKCEKVLRNEPVYIYLQHKRGLNLCEGCYGPENLESKDEEDILRFLDERDVERAGDTDSVDYMMFCDYKQILDETYITLATRAEERIGEEALCFILDLSNEVQQDNEDREES